jgi:hypothetical protein
MIAPYFSYETNHGIFFFGYLTYACCHPPLTRDPDVQIVVVIFRLQSYASVSLCQLFSSMYLFQVVFFFPMVYSFVLSTVN